MITFPSKLAKKLDERKQQDAFRQLRLPDNRLVDFCSNDYLGIVKNGLLHTNYQSLKSGSSGSRLLTGNNLLIEETEHLISQFHKSEAALLYNSGYDANLGVLSCVPQKGDTILYDALCHASIRDGIRLSFAQSFSFSHNDIEDLSKKIQRATGSIFIITESVFSMDGDVCPLKEMVDLAKQYNAYLILDEAHAIGVTGSKGEGLAQHLQLHQDVFCRIYTFGKACGCHGAVVAGSANLKNFLINFSRSFIYSTALPEVAVDSIKNSYHIFPSFRNEREKLLMLIHQFQTALNEKQSLLPTPIQTFFVKGNEEVKRKASELQQAGFDVRAILSPTVPKGTERLRIILHSFNTKEQLDALIKLLQNKE